MGSHLINTNSSNSFFLIFFIKNIFPGTSDLETQVAKLGTDLTKVRQDEFEAQEDLVDVKRQLEESNSKKQELEVS